MQEMHYSLLVLHAIALVSPNARIVSLVTGTADISTLASGCATSKLGAALQKPQSWQTG